MTRRPIVAIDGPAGAGKSTIARAVAARLGYAYLDSGAMYRCVAYAADRQGIPFDDPIAVGKVAAAISIGFQPGSPQRVLLDDSDVTEAIRSPLVSAAASRISVHSEVRRAMVDRQRRLGQAGGVVMEGRDIGSVVFPDAEVKVYLTASDEERARRRWEERRRAGCESADKAAVLEEIRERDDRDRTRSDSPLVVADGARELITDGMTPATVVERIACWALEAEERDVHA